MAVWVPVIEPATIGCLGSPLVLCVIEPATNGCLGSLGSLWVPVIEPATNGCLGSLGSLWVPVIEPATNGCLGSPAHLGGDLAQPCATSRDDSPQQVPAPQPFKASLPFLQADPDTMEDSHDLGRDHGSALAEQPAGVINHKQIAG
jgi:hypothetical protein